jgi:aryl-alcohol dehydrogenase-like predicted oxidoreductase/predicted kinase
MRIGLGCMRLSTDVDRDEARALATIGAALDAGIVVLDTARAYGRDETETGHNERLVARALAASPPRSPVRVITKCGMRRDGGAWIADGRASRILDDARASVAALGVVPVDLLLLHAPDPRTSLATAARALARAHGEGLARRIGVSNVSRKQLEEVAAHAPIAAVEIALGAYDDLAIRNGVVGYCLERSIEIFAHAPLGGPERAPRLARDRILEGLALKHGASPTAPTPLEVFLAYLLAVRPEIMPIVGARRPETIASLVRATELALSEEELAVLDGRFPVLGALRSPVVGTASTREVVLMMGVPGAGKSSAAEAFVARGYERLNRDSLGGTLRGIVRRLDDRLRDGAERVVLDNTYVSRATRNDVLRIAHARGASVRCIFFDTPQHEAQLNVVHRMIDRFGHVLDPRELAAHSKRDPAALAPSAVLRMARDLEPPAADEGFASIEIVSFVRVHGPERGRPAIAMPLDLDARDAILARLAEHAPPGAACLLYAWRPGLDEAALESARLLGQEIARSSERIVEIAICTHPAGPPMCWCRPPLPGLWASFARRHGIDVRESVLLGSSPTDRALARAVGLEIAARRI